MASLFDLFRRFGLRRLLRKLGREIQSGLLDAFLETLLKAMRLMFCLDKEYRRNIEGFNGRYAFQSKGGAIAASAVFAKGKMKVYKHAIEDTHVTVTFKNGDALMRFLFNKNPDIISAVLNNEVTYDGNLIYLGKFAYMARHLQLRFSL